MLVDPKEQHAFLPYPRLRAPPFWSILRCSDKNELFRSRTQPSASSQEGMITTNVSAFDVA